MMLKKQKFVGYPEPNILPETTILVDVDGNSDNLIIRKFGNRIFSKPEKAKILRDLYTVNRNIVEVIIGCVDNTINAYRLYSNNVIMPVKDADDILFDIPGKNNLVEIYDDLEAEIIETLKLSGFFQGLVALDDIESKVKPGGNVSIILPYEKTTVLDIKNRYQKADLPYMISIDTLRRNLFVLNIHIPSLIKKDLLTVRL